MRRTDTCWAFSGCDVGMNDGYTAHLRFLLQLLNENGVTPNLVGYGTRPSVLPFMRRCLNGGGLPTAFLAAAIFVAEIFIHRPQLVVFGSAGSVFNPFFAIAARLSGSAVLYDCQDPALEAVSRLYACSPLLPMLRRYLMWAEKAIDARATLTLCVSPGLEAMLRQRGWKGRISIYYNIHNAVNMRAGDALGVREANGWSDDAIVMVYVGGLQPKIRGIEAQFVAIREARAKNVNVCFAVACSVGHPETFQNLSDPLVRDNAFWMARNLSPEDVRALLLECDLAFNKTLSYALPSKIFEYIASGVLVLSVNDRSDVNALCEQFVILCDDDIASLVSAIASARTSPAARAHRLQKARAFIDKLSAHNQQSVSEFVLALKQRDCFTS